MVARAPAALGALAALTALGAAAGATLIAARPAHAGQLTCSNPGVPVGAAASSDLLPGRLTLNLATTLLPIHGDQVLVEDNRPVRYESDLVLVESRLSAEYALRPWLALGAALPYRLVDLDVAHLDPDTGMPVPASSIHARTETLRGLGDASLTAHLAREVGAYRLHGRFGTSVPIGATVEDPFLLGQIGESHEHVQFGTGTFVPFAAFEVQRAFGPATGALWGLAHVSLYENAEGFRPGHRLSGGLSASTSALVRGWTFGVAAEVHGETAERWGGIVYTDEGNTGRVDVMAGASAAWRPLPGLAVVVDAKLPVYSHVSGSQLDYGLVAGLGIAATFDVGPRASYRGADHGKVGPAGEAAELVPVPGRITVFDLWAAWCAPCRDLDGRLAALARAHPERLAVRKLDVVDPDSAAWRRHLAPGGFDLPHVKVYGADGALLFERTAPPAELARAIEALLR